MRVDLIKNDLNLLQFNKNKWKKIKFKKNNIQNTYFELVDYFFNQKKNKFQSKQIAKLDDALFVLNTIKKIKKDKRN